MGEIARHVPVQLLDEASEMTDNARRVFVKNPVWRSDPE